MIRERLEDWPQRLSIEADAWKHIGHDWDGHDCATFAGNCIREQTGDDVIAHLRGRYKTKVGAMRVIKSEGFDSLDEMIASMLEPCEPEQCGRGDVVLFDGELGEFVGVVLGTYAVAPGAEGLVQVNLKFAKRGYRI